MYVGRKIPYGVMNYEELVRECYFVDNTKCIRGLEEVKTPVFLRPKRFGKSVWCSVLAHYYDVNLKGRFQQPLPAPAAETAAVRFFVSSIPDFATFPKIIDIVRCHW